MEILSESIFRFGKGTKLLTEPIVEWCIGSNGQALFQSREGALHPQSFNLWTDISRADRGADCCGKARLWTGGAFGGLAGEQDRTSRSSGVLEPAHPVDRLARSRRRRGEHQRGPPILFAFEASSSFSQLTLAVYPLLQEAVFDSDVFTAPRETDPNWALARQLFSSLVDVIQRKARWPGEGESGGSIGGLDKEEREGFETWRRDAGEVIICAYVGQVVKEMRG